MAGERIRIMEQERRTVSSRYVYAAVIIGIIVIFAFYRMSSGQGAGSWSVEDFIFKAGILAMLFLAAHAGAWFRRADYAAAGAKAEEEFDQKIDDFCKETGWQKLANHTIERLWSDIDVVLLSPDGRHVIVDIKKKFWPSYLEKNMRQCRLQAVRLSRTLEGEPWVQSILCFKEGLDNSRWRKENHVYITSFEHILDLLASAELASSWR